MEKKQQWRRGKTNLSVAVDERRDGEVEGWKKRKKEREEGD